MCDSGAVFLDAEFDRPCGWLLLEHPRHRQRRSWGSRVCTRVPSRYALLMFHPHPLPNVSSLPSLFALSRALSLSLPSKKLKMEEKKTTPRDP